MGRHVSLHGLTRRADWRSGQIGVNILCTLIGWSGILDILLDTIFHITNGTYGRLTNLAAATI